MPEQQKFIPLLQRPESPLVGLVPPCCFQQNRIRRPGSTEPNELEWNLKRKCVNVRPHPETLRIFHLGNVGNNAMLSGIDATCWTAFRVHKTFPMMEESSEAKADQSRLHLAEECDRSPARLPGEPPLAE